MPFLPLACVRVLDLTSSLAGPTATEILGALGADVIKIEHPDRGDEAREWGPRFFEGGSVMFFSANAGKRSLALDLKSPQGLEALLRLVDGADVAVQSLRPGTAERLGFGPDAVRERNPRLVYATIGAFGPTGPLAAEPGYDPLMQAAAGIMSVTGEADRPPVRVGVSLIDIGTGVWAALAIVAALHEGQGRTLDLSLYETALSLVPYQLVDVLAGGEPAGRHGTAFPLIVPYQVFETADGELMIVAANDRLFAKVCDAVGASELAADPRFATNPLRIVHREALIPLLQARIATQLTADLLARLREAGVPASPVNDLAGVAEEPQLRATGILQELAGRELVSPPFAVDGERVRYRSEPPLLGEHTAEILGEAGYADAEIDDLAGAGIVRVPDPK
jgi:crotonobetainyl-CoA:carnitine CoA-transferase CaiB-like acyl-CoA transferase